MSVTDIKFPDGRVENKEVLINFEKNGTNVIVFKTEKVDNGHKVIGVSYLEDGMYQNIIDADKWNEVKGYLVDALHDRLAKEDLRVVPSEILVTEDPYHPLGLRDENYDKIVAIYDDFKKSMEVSTPVVENQAVAEPAQVVTPEELATPVEPVAPVSEPVTLDVEPQVEEVKTEEIPQVVNEPVKEEEPAINPFAIPDSLEPNLNASVDIVPPVGVDIVPNEPAIDVNTVTIPTAEEPAIASMPTIEETPAPIEEAPKEESIVQNSYENATGTIIDQARNISEKFIQDINELVNKYVSEMEEMRAELSRNLEEAKGINELAKQTYDKAQTIAPTEEVPELTRAA